MHPRLAESVALFANNVQRLRKTFIWKNSLLKRLAALLYAAKGKQIDIDALRESLRFIKENTGVFSYFRGHCAMTIAALLALRDDRHKQLAAALAVYRQMKKEKFWASDYLVVAAYQIAAHTDEGKYAETIRRAKAFYDGMRAKHRLITGRNDYIFAAMLGLSDVALEGGLRRLEALYQHLKPYFRSGDGVQALSQVLALGGEGRDIEGRVLRLSDAFRQRGMRLDRAHTLPSLGLLAMLPVDDHALAGEVVEVYARLRTQKGFGRWSVGKQELLLLCSALVCFDHGKEADDPLLTGALFTSIANIVIAQHTAMVAAAAASASAASSGGS